MSHQEYVSERKLLGIRSDGERIDITVSVGIPYMDDKYDSWACPAKAEGLIDRIAEQHGIDSWQAFRLSQKLIVRLLHDFIDKGGMLFIFGEDKETTKEDIDEFF